MKLNQHLKNWKQIVSYRFPDLSLPQVSGLATWSFGMVMTQILQSDKSLQFNCQSESRKRKYSTPEIKGMV